MKYLLSMCLFISNVTVAQMSNSGIKNMRKNVQLSKRLVEDIVYKINKEERGHSVLFSKHSGVYYLLSNSQQYSSILAALEKSRDGGDIVRIMVDPSSLEIDEILVGTK